MTNKQDEQILKMRWILFWVFIALFALIVLCTIGVVFFNFGTPSGLERALLFRTLGEIGAAVLVLFYLLFSKKITKKIFSRDKNPKQNGEDKDKKKTSSSSIPELINLYDNIQIARTRESMWQMWFESAQHTKKYLLATTRSVGHSDDYLKVISNLKNSNDIQLLLLAPIPKNPEDIKKLIERKNVGFDVKLHHEVFEELPFRYQLVDDDRVVLNIPSSNEPVAPEPTIVSIAFKNKAVVKILTEEFYNLWNDDKHSISLNEYVINHCISINIHSYEEPSGKGQSLEFISQAIEIDSEYVSNIIEWGVEKKILIEKENLIYKK